MLAWKQRFRFFRNTFMMQTGLILLSSIFPMVLAGCCGRNYRMRQTGTEFNTLTVLMVSAFVWCVFKMCKQHDSVGPQQETTQWLYKAVEGENFAMPCYGNVWSKAAKGREGNENTFFNCGKAFVVGPKHSGNYTSLRG